jgi:hypothetical protein
MSSVDVSIHMNEWTVVRADGVDDSNVWISFGQPDEMSSATIFLNGTDSIARIRAGLDEAERLQASPADGTFDVDPR